MQSTTYRLSESYIRKKTRAPIVGAIAFVLILALVLSPWAAGRSLHPGISISIFLVAFAFMFRKNLKISREAAEKLPKMAIEVTPTALRFIESGGTYEVPTSSIKAVAVDRRSQEPKVVYLERFGEGMLQVDDLDRLDQFVAQISRIVGAEKVRDLKWWQGPPR